MEREGSWTGASDRCACLVSPPSLMVKAGIKARRAYLAAMAAISRSRVAIAQVPQVPCDCGRAKRIQAQEIGTLSLIIG